MQQSSWDVGVEQLAGSNRYNMKSLFWCWAVILNKLWSFMRFTRHVTNMFSFLKCKYKVHWFSTKIFDAEKTWKLFICLINSHCNSNSFLKSSISRASGDLQAILDEDGSLTEQKTRCCIREVLMALDYLHRRNIAHLDIKPQNILLNSTELEGKRSMKLSFWTKFVWYSNDCHDDWRLMLIHANNLF